MKTKFFCSILLFGILCGFCACNYKCTEGADNFVYDYRTGKKKIKKSYRLELGILTKRCKVGGCRTKAMHCHHGLKFRGMPWYKNQHPKIGEVDQYGNF
jgi:hypothetical protein